MPTLRFIFLCCALLASLPTLLPAQSAELVRGRIISAADGAPLAEAIVVPLTGHNRASAVTSAGGWFSLTALPGAPLLVLRLGFVPDTVAVPDRGTPLVVTLQPGALDLAPIVVSADRGDVLRRQLQVLARELRSYPSSQDLLRLLPGLVIAQHGGGGKAEQIFLRGFDTDHGTDVALSVDGTPVNLVSHAHGQGYADLHFLPPEVVETVELRRGPLDIRDGNLATAGAVSFRTRDRAPAWFEVRGGAFGARELHAGVPVGGEAGRWGGYVAGSRQVTSGPFLANQDFRRLNLFAKATGPISNGTELVVTGSLYDATWFASGQLPDRAVRSGTVSRFGAIDSTEGGMTRRLELSGAVRGSSRGTGYQVRTYLIRSELDLHSNFTFALRDPEHGDGIQQVDDRWVAGFSAEVDAFGVGGLPGRQAAGISLRADQVNILLAAQRQRVRLGDLTASRVQERHGGVWVRQEWAAGPALLVAGVRGDVFHFGVTDRLVGASFDGEDRPRADGQRLVMRVSPRASAELPLGAGTTLSAGAGLGFHTNDARDVVLAGVGEETVPRALGMELGVRHTWPSGSAAVTAWRTDLSSELVFVGDEGIVEPSGRTRRLGVEVEGRVQVLGWLWADAELTLTRARLRDEPVGADRVPLAPRHTGVLGLMARGGGPWEAGIRVRHLSDRPADESGSITALGHLLTEASAAWSNRCLRAVLSVENLFNAEWNESQFATTSRLPGETAAVTELHYTPGAPRAVTVGVRVRCSGR
ncbi:MAG: TonB-dependent receptor [Gemmatimonadales bacterium]